MLATSFGPQEQEENEMMRFLNESSKSLEILEKYPVVKLLFMKYNTPLPSSTLVERLFSYATLLNLPKSDMGFEKRMLLKVNSSEKYVYVSMDKHKETNCRYYNYKEF